MFKKNVGTIDSAIRIIFGIVALLLGIFLFGALQGDIVGLAAVAVGLVGLITGATRRCPTYVLLGISTNGSETSGTAQRAA